MGSGKKGSQLAQLRSGLRDANVTGSRQQKGKRGDDSADRVGQYRAQQRRKRLDTLMGSLNAFDEKHTRQKHDVLGRKVKGSQGKPTESKSAAQQVRRQRLLPELAARHHSSNFVDRRFGEYNPQMSMDEKMLKRFTAERQKRAAKSSLFNLDDDEGGADDITHFGQSLSGLDTLPDVARDDGEDEGRGKYACRAVMKHTKCMSWRGPQPMSAKVLLEISERLLCVRNRADIQATSAQARRAMSISQDLMRKTRRGISMR